LTTVRSARRAARHRTVATPSKHPTERTPRRLLRAALRRASGPTELARVGRTTARIAGAATRLKVARTNSATTRAETTRAETGTRKVAAAVVAGGVVEIAKTGVAAVAVAISNATTSR
jgi:hypothetical protein